MARRTSGRVSVAVSRPLPFFRRMENEPMLARENMEKITEILRATDASPEIILAFAAEYDFALDERDRFLVACCQEAEKKAESTRRI